MTNFIPDIKTYSAEDFISTIYKLYRDECSFWLMQKFGIGKEDAIDIFQNTIIIFYEKVVCEKGNIPLDKLRPFLYGIARNKGLEYLRSLEKYATERFENIQCPISDQIEEKVKIEYQFDIINKGLDKLSAASKKILSLFYFQGKSISEITIIMGYKNSETTKNMKYKSLQKLKREVESIPDTFSLKILTV